MTYLPISLCCHLAIGSRSHDRLSLSPSRGARCVVFVQITAVTSSLCERVRVRACVRVTSSSINRSIKYEHRVYRSLRHHEVIYMQQQQLAAADDAINSSLFSLICILLTKTTLCCHHYLFSFSSCSSVRPSVFLYLSTATTCTPPIITVTSSHLHLHHHHHHLAHHHHLHHFFVSGLHRVCSDVIVTSLATGRKKSDVS